jgi:hypothetical protein
MAALVDGASLVSVVDKANEVLKGQGQVRGRIGKEGRKPRA